MVRIFRTLFLVVLSFLPGSKQSIKKISVANTGIFFHDGRALATCESGPPIRVQLPNLETVGWFNGHQAEGEFEPKVSEVGFGGTGVMSFMREWTTGHPKIDPNTKELILYHCTFAAPYVHYSVLPSAASGEHKVMVPQGKLLNAPVPRVSGAKMMHDFGVSRLHSVIMDLPLSLDPFNLLKNQAVVAYDSAKHSRFGVFPRYDPSAIRWFETSACCIFHTANTWDEQDVKGSTTAVNMLTCRLTSASLVFNAGNIAAPQPTRETVEQVKKAMPFFEKYDYDEPYVHGAEEVDHVGSEFAPRALFSDSTFDRASTLESSNFEHTPLLLPHQQPIDPDVEKDQCRLYYYRFDLSHGDQNTITHQFALAAIPFEFPTLHPEKEMSAARYIYGCSTSTSSFGAALGRAVKIDVIAKIDALELIGRAKRRQPRSITGCVDRRSIGQVLADNETVANDPIRCFKMPENWYAQEARFVPRATQTSEDDGYLLFYAFNETQIDRDGECSSDATSELWVLDAKNMQNVICKVALPQRVPYGLHGNWFTKEQIAMQRAVERFRSVPEVKPRNERGVWENTRNRIIGMTA